MSVRKICASLPTPKTDSIHVVESSGILLTEERPYVFSDESLDNHHLPLVAIFGHPSELAGAAARLRLPYHQRLAEQKCLAGIGQDHELGDSLLA